MNRLHKAIIPLLVGCACALGLTSAFAAQTGFAIGQPAPEFKAGRWVKGPPVSKLETGQIYVMEFWATWCGPCRAAMPHLSELARKHAGKVTVIGIDIMEHSAGEKADRLVDKLVEQMGKDVDYPVCRDTADEYLTNHWFKPTKSPGIPATIVVDGEGKLAWIGHPKDVEAVLEGLLAGKFDYAKSAAEHSDAAGNNEAMMKVMDAYHDAVNRKAWAEAAAVLDQHPEFASMTWLMRYVVQLNVEPAQAFDKAKEIVAKEDRMAFSYLMAIADTDGLPTEMYRFVADTLGPKPEAHTFGTMAKVAYRLGDSAKAVEYQQKLKDLVLGMKPRPSPETVDQIEADLRKYQGKL